MCSAITCPNGCCSGNVCVAPSATQCGRNGNACVSCGTGTCNNGVCSSCNAQTCPQGCCQNGVCQTVRTVTACGQNGGNCTTCDATRADMCSAFGTCVCGNTFGQCNLGTHCMGGACVCDSTSCRGCCFFNNCSPGTQDQACGRDAGICQFCNGQTQCIDGGCQ